MGGTSTDVSRYGGCYDVVYETTTAGISIQSPQLDINTVAAGGGSCLTFRNGLFRAGPESAGAEPGPVCYRRVEFFCVFHSADNFDGHYRKGGPLAMTDANLLLGRLIPDYFPKIFGKDENEGLDVESSRSAFEKLAKEVNESYAQGSGKELSLDETVYG